MRKILSYLMISLLAFGLLTSEASAKRFGGGRSFGVQRPSSAFSFTKTPTSKFSQNSNKNRWGGLLGGLVIGGLLASLFMQHGLASGLLTWLLVGAVILFLINLFKKRMQPNYQAANSFSFNQNPNSGFQNPYNLNGQVATAEIHPGFNVDAFLREAKVLFMRLQVAYDQKNLEDIREFSSPEVMAEIQMQIQENTDETTSTEISSLDAKILDVMQEGKTNLASVLFTGTAKEANQTETFSEIWHFRQYPNNKWLVCGVQQEQ